MTTTTTDVAPIYRHGTQLGWLFAQANEHEMPAPQTAHTSNNSWAHVPNLTLNFDSLADLTSWAMWAEASIADLIGAGGTFLGYGFEGAISEVRLSCNYFTETREVSA